MKTVIIVQARMTSTRLPGKVLMEVLGKPLLEFQMERLARVRKADGIVIATTTNGEDLPILGLASRLGVQTFRGSEMDVLSRYHGAAVESGADRVVRITSDCPLIDPLVVDEVIAHLDANPELDYASNVMERTYPRGLDCEAFTFGSLDAAFREAVAPPEREHVTPFIHGRPGRFRLGGIKSREDNSRHRWTVDTPEDFALIRKMLEHLYPRNPGFLLRDCLELIARHPDWPSINAGVEQKTVS
jgi:spore coat polysaccharide biosynthesis protein SpsF